MPECDIQTGIDCPSQMCIMVVANPFTTTETRRAYGMAMADLEEEKCRCIYEKTFDMIDISEEPLPNLPITVRFELYKTFAMCFVTAVDGGITYNWSGKLSNTNVLPVQSLQLQATRADDPNNVIYVYLDTECGARCFSELLNQDGYRVDSARYLHRFSSGIPEDWFYDAPNGAWYQFYGINNMPSGILYNQSDCSLTSWDEQYKVAFIMYPDTAYAKIESGGTPQGTLAIHCEYVEVLPPLDIPGWQLSFYDGLWSTPPYDWRFRYVKYTGADPWGLYFQSPISGKTLLDTGPSTIYVKEHTPLPLAEYCQDSEQSPQQIIITVSSTDASGTATLGRWNPFDPEVNDYCAWGGQVADMGCITEIYVTPFISRDLSIHTIPQSISSANPNTYPNSYYSAWWIYLMHTRTDLVYNWETMQYENSDVRRCVGIAYMHPNSQGLPYGSDDTKQGWQAIKYVEDWDNFLFYSEMICDLYTDLFTVTIESAT